MGGAAKKKNIILLRQRSPDMWMQRVNVTVGRAIVSFVHACMPRSGRTVREAVDMVVSQKSCNRVFAGHAAGRVHVAPAEK